VVYGEYGQWRFAGIEPGHSIQAIVPRQMILGTGTGDAAAGAYAGSMGITPEQFVAQLSALPCLLGSSVIE